MSIVKTITDKADAFQSQIRIAGRVATTRQEVALAIWVADEFDGFQYEQARVSIKLTGADAVIALRNFCNELLSQSQAAAGE